MAHPPGENPGSATVKDTKRIRNVEKPFLVQHHATFLHERWFSPFQDHPQRGCSKLISLLFLPPANEVCEDYVFTGVCLSTWGGGGLGLCPSRGVSAPGGGSLCMGHLSKGSLSRREVSVQGGGLCPGEGSVQEGVSLSRRGVSGQEGGLWPGGGLCPGGVFVQEGGLCQGDSPCGQRTSPYEKERAVHILLECVLVLGMCSDVTFSAKQLSFSVIFFVLIYFISIQYVVCTCLIITGVG